MHIAPVVGATPALRQGGTLTVTLPLPFKDSRRLAGENAFVPGPGVALDVIGIDLDDELFVGWHERVLRVRELLGWPGSSTVVRTTGSATLAFEAPAVHLALAMEANEWALCAALLERDPFHWGCLRDSLAQCASLVGRAGQPPEIDEPAAFARLLRLAASAPG